MELPGGDPKEVLDKVSKELKQKFDDCGMGEVEAFMGKLDKVGGMLEAGPAALLEKMNGLFNEFKKKIEAVMEDPKSLAPSGSSLANCASWYGKSVCKKLKVFTGDVDEIIETVKEFLKELEEPIKKLGETMSSVMEALGGSVAKLAKLPAEVTKLADEVGGPEDVAKIETDSMKKSLDVSGISSPLDSLGSLKEPLKAAVEAVKKGVQRILDFIKDAPGTVKKAFDVPYPCCGCQGCMLSQAPAALTQLNVMIDGLKDMDLNPVIEGFESVSSAICDLDPAKVTDPVNKFAEAAASHVDELDKVVQAAKLATGGGGGLMAKVKGLF